MNATRASAATQPVIRDLTCDQCGYLRVGLSTTAACPECGSPPSVPIVPLSSRAGAVRDRAQQAWLFTLTGGLILLIVSSFFAVQSEFFIRDGGLTLAMINAPAPKLTAAACLLREMGDPAEWGVQGFIATLGTVLAVWLITQPRADRADEPLLSLRRITRVVMLLSFGGLFGVLISSYEISIRFWGWWAMPALVLAVGLVELPVNTLLYLYLAQLSRRFDPSDRPSSRYALTTAAGLAAASCLCGLLLSVLRYYTKDEPVGPWRLGQVAYGVLAISSGVMMTVGVCRLTIRMIAASLDTSMLAVPGALRNQARLFAPWVAAVRSDPTRFAAVAGMMLWLLFTRPLLALSVLLSDQYGVLHYLPTMNFIGPKVSALMMLRDQGRGGSPEVQPTVFFTLAALWLITAYRPSSRWPSGTAVRWVATLAISATLGLLFAIERAAPEVRRSLWNVSAVSLLEAPCTLLLYLHVANIAAAIAKPALAFRLRVIGGIATGLIAVPMLYWMLETRRLHQTWRMMSLEAAVGMLVVLSSLIAWTQLVELTWALLNVQRRFAPAIQRSAEAIGP